jgi:hypothetical protein
MSKQVTKSHVRMQFTVYRVNWGARLTYFYRPWFQRKTRSCIALASLLTKTSDSTERAMIASRSRFQSEEENWVAEERMMVEVGWIYTSSERNEDTNMLVSHAASAKATCRVVRLSYCMSQPANVIAHIFNIVDFFTMYVRARQLCNMNLLHRLFRTGVNRSLSAYLQILSDAKGNFEIAGSTARCNTESGIEEKGSIYRLQRCRSVGRIMSSCAWLLGTANTARKDLSADMSIFSTLFALWPVVEAKDLHS